MDEDPAVVALFRAAEEVLDDAGVAVDDERAEAVAGQLAGLAAALRAGSAGLPPGLLRGRAVLLRRAEMALSEIMPEPVR